MKLLIAALLLAAMPVAAAEIPLNLEGLPGGEALRGPALASVVIATGKDGYRVVFSLAEIDAKLGNRPVFIVDRCAGAPLAAEDGPLRLVVPGEARAARSVRQLTGVRVAAVPE